MTHVPAVKASFGFRCSWPVTFRIRFG